MKTTKRSKMLLSSIAMLLVALVALGSATFAWYSITRTVNASDLTVKASTPGGLQISDDNSTWSDHVTWTDSATLQPSTWTATAADPGYTALQVSDSDSVSSAQSGESLVNAPLTADNYVIAKTIYLKNTNSVAGNVTGTVTSTNTAGSYMRMKLVDAADGTVYADINSHTASANGATFKLAKNASAAQKTFYVVVYADGQDANCTTNNANDATKNTDIDFTISFSMVDTTD
jgi:hypothetical protein